MGVKIFIIINIIVVEYIWSFCDRGLELWGSWGKLIGMGSGSMWSLLGIWEVLRSLLGCIVVIIIFLFLVFIVD